MPIDAKHPQYTDRLPDWEMMRDTYEGERAVKERGTKYLPATSGMNLDGMQVDQPGWKAYNAYVTRAVFHDFVREAVEDLIGVMHHKAPKIELPKVMEPLLGRATTRGESLAGLLRRINEAQLTTGRIGLMLDIPKEPPVDTKPLPYIATYKAEDVINWDYGTSDDATLQVLNLVVLNETEQERQQDFQWEQVNKFRVLQLGEHQPVENEAAGSVYKFGVFRGDAQGLPSFSEEQLEVPSIMGRTLQQIPFVFINTKDIVPDPDSPPLKGLASLSLAIYRGEADYRQNLFMQGQDTLVTIGLIKGPNEDVRVGTGARIDLPSGPGNDAKYIGVESAGLQEQRECLENDKKMALAKGGQMLDTTSRQKESGDALKTRVSAQTASLNQIAMAGAFALETLLKIGAIWLGEDPEKVKVTPNLDFDAAPMTGKDLADYTSAKNQGAPIARRTIHKLLVAKNVTDLTYEEEMKEIEEEEPITVGVTLPIDPNAEADDGDGEEGDE